MLVMKIKLDKIGTLGIWIAALSCPACFPALIQADQTGIATGKHLFLDAFI